MLYTVRYKTVGYHSQSYQFVDIECRTIKQAIEAIDLRGELASGTVILYKKLPNDSRVRCHYNDWNQEMNKIRNEHKVAEFSGKFISSMGYGGHFNMEGVDDINNWQIIK